jgi:hypothetical protein
MQTITLKITSTNGTTMLDAFEAICAELKKFQSPQGVIQSEYWKVEVLDDINCSPKLGGITSPNYGEM